MIYGVARPNPKRIIHLSVSQDQFRMERAQMTESPSTIWPTRYAAELLLSVDLLLLLSHRQRTKETSSKDQQKAFLAC